MPPRNQAGIVFHMSTLEIRIVFLRHSVSHSSSLRVDFSHTRTYFFASDRNQYLADARRVRSTAATGARQRGPVLSFAGI